MPEQGTEGLKSGRTSPVRSQETARGRGRRKQASSGSDSAGGILLTPESFKQALLKYARRDAYSGRPFSAIAVTISDYREISQEFGIQTAEQVNHLCRDLFCRGLQGADRLSNVAPGFFLILLPETEKANAELALARLSAIAAASRLQFHELDLKPEYRLSIAHFDFVSSRLDVLLSQLDCQIDRHGNLVHMDAASHPAGKDAVLASCDSWMERFESVSRPAGTTVLSLQVVSWRAADRWKERTAVEITRIDLRQCPQMSLEDLVKKARGLKEIDHPAVQPIVDFYLGVEADETPQYFLVTQDTPGLPLVRFLADNCLGQDVALEWIFSLLNGAIYLLGLMPPVIIAPLSPENIFVKAGERPLIAGYQLPYLFCQQAGASAQSLLVEICALIISICQKSQGEAIAQVMELSQSVMSGQGPRQLNTVHKLRSAVRRIVNKQESPPANISLSGG